LFPGIVEKRIKIYSENDAYWGTAEVKGFTGNILQLKDLILWNHRKKPVYDIEAKYIKRIEII
jgi:hypothetical protein